jgi:hypothetical protein
MPFKNYADKLAYYRQYWKDRPEAYKKHLLKCSENRKKKKAQALIKGCGIDAKRN